MNEKNGMVTGRQFSKLVTIKAEFDGSTLTLNAEGREKIQATIPMVGETVYTEVFGMKCEGIDMGPEIGAWIAEHLEKSHLKLRLVYHDYSDKSSTRQLQASLFDFPRFDFNFCLGNPSTTYLPTYVNTYLFRCLHIEPPFCKKWQKSPCQDTALVW